MNWVISLLIMIALGAVAGWLASMIMRSNLSLVWCIILGIAGSVIGGLIANLIGLSGGTFVQFLIAVGGACVLILVGRLLRKA